MEDATLVDIQVHGLQKMIFLKFNNEITAAEKLSTNLSRGFRWTIFFNTALSMDEGVTSDKL